MTDLLTPTAAANLRHAMGDAFEPWLAHLPRIVQDMSWSSGITPGRPFPGAEFSALLEVRTSTGEPALLRIRPDAGLARNESMALWTWGSLGAAPRVLASNLASGALLMERITPGTSIADELISADELQRVASLLTRIHAALPPSGVDIPTAESALLARLEGALHALPHIQSPPVSAQDINRSASLVTRLATTPHRRVLLHGDLGPQRILSSQEGLVVISPKPLLGDPCLDVATYALRRDPATAHQSATELSAHLGVHPARTADWVRALAPDLALLQAAYNQGTPESRSTLAAASRS